MSFFEKLYVSRRSIEHVLRSSPKPIAQSSPSPPAPPPITETEAPQEHPEAEPTSSETEQNSFVFDPLAPEDDYENLFERLWEARLTEQWAAEGGVSGGLLPSSRMQFTPRWTSSGHPHASITP